MSQPSILSSSLRSASRFLRKMIEASPEEQQRETFHFMLPDGFCFWLPPRASTSKPPEAKP